MLGGAHVPVAAAGVPAVLIARCPCGDGRLVL